MRGKYVRVLPVYGFSISEKGEGYVTNSFVQKNEAGTSSNIIVISESLYVQAPKTLEYYYNIEKIFYVLHFYATKICVCAIFVVPLCPNLLEY